MSKSKEAYTCNNCDLVTMLDGNSGLCYDCNRGDI
jgi:hypothetical protein